MAVDGIDPYSPGAQPPQEPAAETEAAVSGDAVDLQEAQAAAEAAAEAAQKAEQGVVRDTETGKNVDTTA